MLPMNWNISRCFFSSWSSLFTAREKLWGWTGAPDVQSRSHRPDYQIADYKMTVLTSPGLPGRDLLLQPIDLTIEPGHGFGLLVLGYWFWAIGFGLLVLGYWFWTIKDSL